MKKILPSIFLFLIWANSYTQATFSWSRDFEVNLNNYYDEAPKIETDNQTIKVIGKKNTINGQRLEIVKYNLVGDVISATSFGNDVSNTLIIDYKFDSNDQLYLLMAATISYNKLKIILQKYNLNGSIIWTEQIENVDAISNRPCSLGLTTGNCIFINAYKESNYPEFPTDFITTITTPYLYAYDQNGSFLWQRAFNSNEIDEYFAGTMLVYNETAFLFSNHFTLVKVDSNNNLSLYNTIGLSNAINSTQFTNDGNLLITSVTGKFKITKTDSNGASIWFREYTTFLPSSVLADEIKSVLQDSDGNIYVTGRHYGNNYETPTYTNADILTLKYSPNGDLLWENRYQYGINNADIGNCITLKNGYLYVGGQSQRSGISTDYNYTTIKINASTGVTNQVYRYNGLQNGDDSVSSICVLDNGNYAITGLSYINSKYNWTTQFFADPLSIKSNPQENNLEISPNPVSAGQFISIKGDQCFKYKLISSVGQTVQAGNINPIDNQILLIENRNAGIYLLQLDTGTEVITKKLIVK
jgi:hypothetical protein